MAKPLSLLAGILLGAGAIAPAHAAEPAVALQGEVKLERAVVVDGVRRTELVEPKVVVPGDRLRFVTRYRNAAAVAAQNFVITNVVPVGVVLAGDAPVALDLSVDGGKSWGRLSDRTVPDGRGGRRAATAADVTHVRWKMATIAPGASGAVDYPAVVR